MRIEMRDVERQLEEGHTDGSWCLAQWGVGPAPGEQGLFVSTLVMRVDGDVERLALELYGLDDRDGEPPRGWQLLGQAAQSGVGSTLAPLMGDLSRFSSFRLVANLSGERGAGVRFSVAVGEIEGGPGQLPAR